jgi:hypothetical protein
MFASGLTTTEIQKIIDRFQQLLLEWFWNLKDSDIETIYANSWEDTKKGNDIIRTTNESI